MTYISSIQSRPTHRDEIDFSLILNQLFVDRWLIVFITSFVLVLGVFYASVKKPQYRSDTLMQFESIKSKSETIALIQSRFILDPVIQSLGLDINASPTSVLSRIVPWNKKEIRVSLFKVPQRQMNQSFNLVYDKINHVSLYNSAKVLMLQGPIGAMLVNTDNTIQLQVVSVKALPGTQFSLVKRSKTPILRMLIKNLKFDEFSRKQNLNTGILEISMIGDDQIQTNRILNAVTKITKHKDAQKIVQELDRRLGFLNDKLQTTRALLKKSEVTLNHYREQNGKYGIKYTDGLYLEQLKVLGKELSSLHIKKTNMLKNYTLEHPIQKDMDIQTRFIEAQRNQLEKKLKILSASDQIIDNLTRDLSITKELYLNLLNKIQNLKVVKKNATSNIQIISPASFSDVLVPSKGKIYLGSILLGLILSVIIVLGRKLLSRRVEDPGWADKNFNLENLAIIPYSIEQRQNTLKFRGQNCREMRLLAHTNPRHIAIESLRGLRTSLQVASICASNNCISILSVVPGVGKSFVSANLAYLLAISGKRVLLIDGDLRQGNLHHYMNVPSLPGLTEVICKTAAIEDALSETINKNLFFLPRGAITSDPSALLMSEHFKTLMINFSEQYDVVIIDTTPMLLVTDAVLISSVAATNYLVLGAGAHQPREIEQVLHRLGKYGVRLNGSIFNFYSPETFLKSHGQYGKHAKKSLYYKHCHAELMKH